MFCPVGSNRQLNISAWRASRRSSTEDIDTSHRMRAAQADDGCLEIAGALDAANEAFLAVIAGRGDDELVTGWGIRTCSLDELTFSGRGRASFRHARRPQQKALLVTWFVLLQSLRCAAAHLTASRLPLPTSTPNHITRDAAVQIANRNGNPFQLS